MSKLFIATVMMFINIISFNAYSNEYDINGNDINGNDMINLTDHIYCIEAIKMVRKMKRSYEDNYSLCIDRSSVVNIEHQLSFIENIIKGTELPSIKELYQECREEMKDTRI